MGLSCSSLQDLQENVHLKRLCSVEAISHNDPIWNKLFSHSLKPIFTKEDALAFDEKIANLQSTFATNNLTSHNLIALIKVFELRSDELQSSVQTYDDVFIWQAYNALFIIRNICKHFAEWLDEGNYMAQFQNTSSNHVNGFEADKLLDNDLESLKTLINKLFRILVEIPVNDSTYLLHLEAANTLIVLFSVQMFWSKSTSDLVAFRTSYLGADQKSAALVIKALLSNYTNHTVPPSNAWNNSSGSIVIGVASGLWNILRRGVGLGNSDDIMDGLRKHNLSHISLHLLLILTNHCIHGLEKTPNHFRDALIAFGNQTEATRVADGISEEENCSFQMNYSKLFNTICKQIHTDETTLLFYILIHGNKTFRSYIMARSDIEQLVLPILKTVYNALNSTSHHIYMSLIILLILSEDELFNQQVHDITLKNVSWYNEKFFSQISLGGLIILVVIRTVQYNILKMRDKYLHTNCLAALANMSSKFRGLHSYVSERMVSLFETLAKRHCNLVRKLNEQPINEDTRNPELTSELVQDITVLEEVIRMVLEILNSVLTHQVPQNKHLIYTLLYKKDVFSSFRDYDVTQELIQNVDTVVTYFCTRIETNEDLTIAEVMKGIEVGILHWSPGILKKFPDLKFRYIEEGQPEEFFVPYVWSLIYRNSGLYWSPINLVLLTSNAEYAV